MSDRNLIYGFEKVLNYGTNRKNGIFRPELNLRNSKLSGKVLNYVKNLKMVFFGKSGKMENSEKVGKKLQTMRPYATNCHLGLTHCPGF